MTDETDIKYDVAFSFLAEDEPVAAEIGEKVSETASTFLYSQQQTQLAGRDGEQVLNTVFATEARTVFVLYRRGWGLKGWTGIEATAIRNRGFDHGYDFATFAPLDSPPQVPEWLPKNRIWLDLGRFGINGAAAVIEARVREAGGDPRQETLSGRAARLNRRLEAEKAREAFRFSFGGVDAAQAELAALFELITSGVQEATCEQAPLAAMTASAGGRPVLVVSGSGVSLSVSQAIYARNNLDDSEMVLVLWKGFPRVDGVWVFEDPKQLEKVSYQFDMGPGRQLGWRESGRDRLLTSAQVAEVALKMLLDCIEEERFAPERR